MGQAIALAVCDPAAAGRTYNVAEPQAFSELEWARRIADCVGWTGEIVELPEGRQPDPVTDVDTAQDLVVDSSAIREELGYRERVDPDEALARTIEWERANPPSRIDPRRFDYAAEDAVLASLPR